MTQSWLNTPAKRIGLLVLIVGAVMFAFGIMQFVGTYSTLGNAEYAFRRGPFWALRNVGNRYDATGAFLLWLGTIMVIGGLVASYFYEQTVGKVVHWIRTGSLPQSAPRLVAPPAPRSALVVWIADVLLSLLQNWATALLGLVMGVVYQQMGKPEYVLAPAGIALLFWVQAAVRTAVAGDGHDPTKALALLLVVKLVVAYLFFGIGLLLATTGIIR